MNEARVDAMELELRQLPQVLAVAIQAGSDNLAVHILASSGDASDLRRSAAQIAEGHTQTPVTIDVAVPVIPHPVTPVVAGGRQRVQLLTVRRPSRGDEVEVHLAFRGARTVGRGPFGTLAGSVDATIDALRGLGAQLPFDLKAATRVGIGDDLAVLVVFSGRSFGDRMGIARADTVEESTCRATLHALNRFLDQASAFGRPGTPAVAG